MKLEHVGWITRNIKLFESFWVDILGFEEVKRSEIEPEMSQYLFGLYEKAIIVRYRKPEWETDIEIHWFFGCAVDSSQAFHRLGLNHICINTGGPGSKMKFLNSLPDHVSKKVYHNPRGWTNAFIKDFEGNWCEVREDPA